MERPRLCDRPGCGAAASASLTFDYAGRSAWLDDLDEPHPARFELCARHAQRLSVPLGWTFEDRRRSAPAPGMVEAGLGGGEAADELVEPLQVLASGTR